MCIDQERSNNNVTLTNNGNKVVQSWRQFLRFAISLIHTLYPEQVCGDTHKIRERCELQLKLNLFGKKGNEINQNFDCKHVGHICTLKLMQFNSIAIQLNHCDCNSLPVLLLKPPQFGIYIKRPSKVRLPLLMSILR